MVINSQSSVDEFKKFDIFHRDSLVSTEIREREVFGRRSPEIFVTNKFQFS